MTDLEKASELYTVYQRLRDELIAEKTEEVDPNIFTMALTKHDPKFAAQYPVVIKLMAIRGQFFSSAFETYAKYKRETSMDTLNTKHLEIIEAKKRKGKGKARAIEDSDPRLYDPERAEAAAKSDPEDIIESRLLARAEMDAYYVYLTIKADLRNKYPHNWRQHLPGNCKEALAAEIKEELRITDARNSEATKIVDEEEKETLLERRRHVQNWLNRSVAIPNYEAEFKALAVPSYHDMGSAAASVEEWKQGGLASTSQAS